MSAGRRHKVVVIKKRKKVGRRAVEEVGGIEVDLPSPPQQPGPSPEQVAAAARTLAASKAVALEAALDALEAAALLLPHLGGLIRLVDVVASPRVPTAGVLASGRIIVNTEWFPALPLPDRIFVMAHEVLHLALRTHERCGDADPKVFNIAHDYIINDILREELGTPVPAQGLDMPGASKRSAEEIVRDLQSQAACGYTLPSDAWSGVVVGRKDGRAARNSALGDALAKAAIENGGSDQPAPRSKYARKHWEPRSVADLIADRARQHAQREAAAEAERRQQPGMLDVLDAELERELFPDETPASQERRRVELDAGIEQALALGTWRDKIANGFKVPDETAPVSGSVFNAVRLASTPPWEQSLQSWMEDMAPADRTFSRPSRRQGDRADVVLPGRRRSGWTLNLILDTSGSMWSEIAKLLGIIKDFCEAMGIVQVRILQCGERLECDELVETERLDSYRILGGHGGDLGPGFERLAQDIEVEAVIAITDGMVLYPPFPAPPFDVLWAQVGDYTEFKPGYGRIIKVRF